MTLMNPMRRRNIIAFGRPSRPRRLERTLYSIVFVLCVASVYLLFATKDPKDAQHLAHLSRRGTASLTKFHTASDCRLVHHAADQCAHILEHCTDEEAGMFSYLTLYYCRLQHVKGIAFLILVLWLGLLFSTIGVAASDFFCVNLSTISKLLGMSESLAGVTFLALGNGSADVFSTFAAFNSNSGSLAVGELIGAAGFITAVVAGSMAIVRPFNVARKSFVRDVVFFIIAVAFSMLFLYDGILHLWECVTMVGIYIFYVFVILVWHWWFDRRRKRRITEALARAQFAAPGQEEDEVFEAYHDHDDDQDRHSVRTMARSVEDIATLERAPSRDRSRDRPIEADEEESRRERMLGELNSNMRVSRPQARSRSNTQSAIRPSLVGALEFRAVLGSLQKSRNLQTLPIGLQPYSDDPPLRLSPQTEVSSAASDPNSRRPQTKNRMLSGGHLGDDLLNADVASALQNTSGQSPPRPLLTTGAIDRNVHRLPSPDLLGPLTGEETQGGFPWSLHRQEDYQSQPAAETSSPQQPASTNNSKSASPTSIRSRPKHSIQQLQQPESAADESETRLQRSKSNDYQADGTGGKSADSQPPGLPQLIIPDITPVPSHLPRPLHHRGDSFASLPNRSRSPSLRLPPASLSPSLIHQHDEPIDAVTERPLSWWPYKYLPSPTDLCETLFPTLVDWRSKSFLGKVLGLVAASSVFLLTLTLPVVEVEKEDDDEDSIYSPDSSPERPSRTISQSQNGLPKSPYPGTTDESSIAALSEGTTVADGGAGNRQGSNHHHHHHHHHQNGGHGSHHQHMHGGAANVSFDQAHVQNLGAEPVHQRPNLHRLRSDLSRHAARSKPTSPSTPPESTGWNRWLVIVQIFAAPAFVATVLWANTDASESPNHLLRSLLISPLISLILLALLLLTTTPDHPPRWRPGLCFAGFIVAIAWISSIANEVVGVLKAFGVILNISDAILGLTIFAVGNSLGDLVADITVARLGYPVMALSACFGGPLLNILLGVGLSGCYITLRGAKERHTHHPPASSALLSASDMLAAVGDAKFKPYHIQVSRSLIVSGATLLLTLVSLLVVVPLRGWRMDRPIGWGLVALWTVSTTLNVLFETFGWGKG